ncbi:hypothetical protein EDB82DRAFT_523674 [Fusarium venenatum]|uniref:uncharacterized protein n=1 Tax=Fusarium venenatum TaxID=56646 RepID=UPI001DCBCCF7|nr:hypothetical protein EDB82DRAFT_523674 [Fusarium venenatum]
MPPRAVRDGSSFYANNPSVPLVTISFIHCRVQLPRAVVLRQPEFAELFHQSRLQWPGLCQEQAAIVVNYLMEDVYRSERPIIGSTFNCQRQDLHDAIILHFQGLVYRLPGLRALCRMEIIRAAVTMPLLAFVGCLPGYPDWIQINSRWFDLLLYHRIRMEIPDAVSADIQEFRSLEFITHYCLVVAVAGTLYIALDDINQGVSESSD